MQRYGCKKLTKLNTLFYLYVIFLSDNDTNYNSLKLNSKYD